MLEYFIISTSPLGSGTRWSGILLGINDAVHNAVSARVRIRRIKVVGSLSYLISSLGMPSQRGWPLDFLGKFVWRR